MAGRKEIPREISIYVNDVQVVNSFAGITREINKTNNEIRNLNRNSATYEEDLARLQTRLGGLRDSQSQFREEINQTTESAGSAQEAFSKIFLGLSSGNLTLAKEGFNEIKGSINGMFKSALAFIATPLGAAIAVLSGIAIGTKAIFDFNVQAEKSAVLIENLSGKTGQVVEDIRVKMQAMTDTFGLSFDQLAAAVDNLVDTGVAKDELEALDKIKKGLLTAPDKNEFINSLESSAVVSKQLGLDLEDVIALKKQIETTGVNPEATFGALEKATQRLLVGADGLRKKMSTALGAAFTDDVLAKVTTGQISITKALDLINTKSKEVGLNQSQQAELGKELFGKGAIAAGGYATVLDTVAQSIKKQKEPLNENQIALENLEKANERVGKAQSELFRVKDFGSIWTNIKVAATDALASILNWIIDVKKDIQPLIDFIGVLFVQAWDSLKTSVSIAFDFIGGILKVFSNAISTTFNFVKKIFQGDFKGALNVLKNGFVALGNIVGETFGKIKNSIINGLKAIVENIAPFLDAIGFDVDRIQKKLDSFKSKEVKLKTTSENSSGSGDNPEKANTKATEEELAKQQAIRDAARQKELAAQKAKRDKEKAAEEKTDKELADMAIALAKAKADLAKAQLDELILQNRTKLKADKDYNDESVQDEKDRLLAIANSQKSALLTEEKEKIEAANKNKKSEEEFLIEKEAIETDFANKRLDIEQKFQDNALELDKHYTEIKKQLALEQLQAQNELDILEAENKFQADTLKQNQEYQANLVRFKKLLEDKKITQAQYDRFAEASKKQQDALNRTRELQQVQGTLGGLSQVAGAIGEMFGQSKGLAIAQAGINGAMAVTSILAQYPKFDGGFAMWAAIAAAGITTIAQIGKITTAKAPATPKFFYGGPTGNTPFMGTDEHGPVTGVVHSNEWVAPAVMTQSPKYAATFAWLENERKSIVANKFASGGETSSGTIPNFSENNTSDSALLMAITKLNDNLEKGIKAYAQIGYKEAEDIQKLNQERIDSSNYGKLNE